MLLIVGLGNPGKQYAFTRHNIGFLLVENLAGAKKWTTERKFNSQLVTAEWFGNKVVLCQPQTYMNLSGEAVGSLVSHFRLSLEQVLVVVDDANLPFGEVRLRGSGSSGGHHGLESIERHLGTKEFPRLRIGIGRLDGARQISDYVLGRFSPEESEFLETIITRAAEQVRCWASEGIAKAMSQFNGAINKEEKGN